ncbi:metallophosphoesterase family protein [Methylocaldum sp.]|uniref:metallophosphoesterase family protein n=1 Tax=Methylocaldum sp. TaxID=1969727 RepID=UPI002D41B3CC|nr:metallophosphoesterase [Methylocaldum sp.]HYE34200.1 metallophosphoesterase [Methylocaldum sp.]
MPSNRQTVRLAAIGDLHYTLSSQGMLQTICAYVSENADILLLCGDIVDYGRAEEARLFVKELNAGVKIPILGVLGNHEYEAGQVHEVQHIFSDAGIILLDGDAHEIHGIGFAGVKGFAGGFGEHALQAWGESTLKQFVHEAVDESLKLESALAKLRTRHRIALLHYAPVRATVEGEPVEIYPFLGSSRLEEPLNRYSVTAVFHGHAHRGHPTGKTSGNIPVYNVAVPLLRRAFPDRPPVRLIELPVGDSAESAHQPSAHKPHPVPG